MQFLTPLGLLLAALAVPILLLYMLKLRRKQVQVSSTFLWTQLLRDRQANAPWQKLRRNLLLILQLIILAALTLAFARPVVQTPTVTSGSVIILLDGSASMGAADVSPSRFEAARKIIQDLIDRLPDDAHTSLILVSGTPHPLAVAEGDKSLLRKALGGARPSEAAADWQSGFALAAGAAHAQPGATIVIVSDGGLPSTGLPALPGDVRYIPVGTGAANLAITGLALRPAPGGPELFAEVTNYSGAGRDVLLSIYRGETLIDARTLSVAAGRSQNLTLDRLPPEAGLYKAHLSNPQGGGPPDVFALDDTAFAVYRPASARRVLLVSKGNLYLEQLLAALPGIQPFRVLPDKTGAMQLPNETFDLYVLDGIAPAPLPAGSLLFVDPPGNALFQVGAPFKEMTNPRVWDDPLTRFVNWSNVHVLQAGSVPLPAWARPLVSVDAGPLVFAGETDNRRVAVVTFDLRESDLPLQVAFPVLFTNLIDALIPAGAFDASRSLRPGESLSIAPQPGVEQVVVGLPSGQTLDLQPGPDGFVFTGTSQTGYYTVNLTGKGSRAVEYFAVNLFDPGESDIGVRPTIQVGHATLAAARAEQVGQADLWPWLAGLALLVLLVEWQLFHRRQLPTAKSILSSLAAGRGRGA